MLSLPVLAMAGYRFRENAVVIQNPFSPGRGLPARQLARTKPVQS